MDGGSTPVITTATSQSDGRLIVGAGRPTRGIPLAGSSSSLRNKKRKYLKDIVSKNKKDGKGGLGMTTNAPNSPLDNSGAALPPTSQYSLTPQNNVISTANPSPALSLSNSKTTGFRMARPLKLKRMNTIQASINGINKKMKLGKVGKKI